jgi:glycosyltransferase involved in cell wall biosynthesis
MKADYPWPLDVGEKKRTYNLLKHSHTGFSVFYLGYQERGESTQPPRLAEFVRREETVFRQPERRAGTAFYLRLLANLGSSTPYFVVRGTRRELQDRQRQIFRDAEIDLVVCDGLDMVGNVDFSLPAPKVLLSHGIEAALWQQRYETSHGLIRRAYFNYETKRTAAFETEMCNQFDLILAVSAPDRDRLETDFKVRVPIEVIQTGVDCAYFAPDTSVPVVPRRLVFTGSGDMLSNIDGLLWFAAEAYPLIRREYPDVTLAIIGPDPAAEIRALGEKDPSIRVTGWVEDVRPYLAAADVFIVPLRVPGGTRVKVYEAMAMKTPVVSTNHGVEGLPVADGVHLLTAADARGLAACVLALFGNSHKRTAVAEAGFRMVNESYDWSVMARRMVDICRHLVRSSK